MSILQNTPIKTIIPPRSSSISVFAAVYDMGAGGFLVGLKTQTAQEPNFIHTNAADFPEMEYDGMHARVVMGNLWGKSAPITTFSDTLYLDITLEANATFELPTETEERAIYVLSGQIEIAGITHNPAQMLIFRPDDKVVVKACTNNQTPVRLLVLGGETMDGDRHIWWNFTSSNKDRIEQAKADWNAGKFDMVTDDPEFIPLPE